MNIDRIRAGSFAGTMMIVGLALHATPAHAQENIITPVSATSTTTIGGSRTITAAIDGTLLSSGGTSGDILSETVSYAGSAGHWLSASSAVDDDTNFRSTTEVLTFDLGGAFDVDTFHLWPYVRVERARGLSSFDIAFSSDGINYSTPITLSGFTIGPPGTTTGEPVQTQTFALQSGVTHIRMTNLTTFGSTDYIAISELRFGSPDVTAPTIDLTDPADGAMGVVVGSDLVATFDENIALVEGGTITIHNLGPSTDLDEVITIPDARLTVSGTDLVINPGSDLVASNQYAVRISDDAVEDLAPTPNTFEGIDDDTTWNFGTAADATAPSLVLPTFPADDASDVATDTLLVATFDENIVAGSGSITIKNLTEGTETVIPVGDAQVTVSGTQLSVDPAANLDPGDDHAIQLDAGIVTDTTGNPFAGILDPDVTSWNFTTASDTTNPTILSLSPTDDASGVAAATPLVATFDEAIVAAGTAGADNRITLRNLTENTEDVFALDDPGVSIAGNTLTIVPGTVLDSGDAYAVRIGADALTDLSGNPFAGILDDTGWNFSVSTGPVIITPTSAVSATGNLSNRPIGETINGNGLSSGGLSGDILSETHNVNSGNSGEYWIGTLSGAALTFTLPSASTVDAVHLWNYSRTGETDRGIQSFDISFSTDGGSSFGPTISISGVAIGPFPNPTPVQSFSFASQSGVTDIRLDNIVNYGDTTYVGLSEIRFGGPGSGGGGKEFIDWIAGYPGVGAQTGVDDDPDLDGNDNGVENFFGTAPDTFTQGLVSGTVTAGNTFTFTHPRNATPATDLTATYRWSTDLQTFYNDGDPNGVGTTTVTFSAAPDTPVAGTTSVTATISGTVVPDKLFVDVEVTQN